MRILFLGNFEALYSSENYYKKTFEEMGHVVIDRQEGKITGSQLLSDILKIQPELFFWVHTHQWQTAGIEDCIQLLRKHNVPTVAFHLDLYMGIQRWGMYKDVGYLHLLDHFFTVDKLMADWLNENTKTKGHFLPAGVYEGECFIGTANKEKYPHEIIFTGSKGYHPEYSYRPQLIDWLHETYGSRFGHYGGGGLPTVRGPELNNLYASAKIVIGDTLCKNFDYPYYVSDRFFEVPGRGGFMIFPYIKGTEAWFDGNEVPTYDFNNFEQLKHQIDWFLAHNETRERFRMNGFLRAKNQHTYKHRLEELLMKLELSK